MPQRAQRVCGNPGCGRLCSNGYCDAHAASSPRAVRRRQFDAQRGSAHARGYGRRWERLRKMVLTRDPLCMIQTLCGRGLDRPGEAPHLPALSTEADHVVPRPHGDDSMVNLQGACHACHSRKTATADSGFAGGRGVGFCKPSLPADRREQTNTPKRKMNSGF
jgi:5-methylcytosine-specific restriction protein A